MTVNLSDIGDQTSGAAEGYASAAERIEIEIGKPMGRVLDVGCNVGAGMEALAALWPDAVMNGLEPVAELTVKARAKGFRVHTGKAEGMPWPEGAFDLVISRHSLEHVEFRRRAILEMRRVLVPGGHVYIQAPVEPGGSKNKLHLSPFESAEELRTAMLECFREIYWGPQETVAEFIGRAE